ncbi:MAG: GatB/YqeY domain-containing protein [Candidatus Harrisonbacteria bacterium]|nr:GatB/YqeY domain-containing protein [Candidatus Harrisonbacteria bacterium]
MLKERLQDELKAALKSGDSTRRLTVGMVLSAIKNRELEKRNKLSKTGVQIQDLDAQSTLTDDETLEVIAMEVKKRKEAFDIYTQNSRADLAEKEKTELNVLLEFLPEQMSEDEVRTEVKQAISQANPQGLKDMGKVISQVMAKVKGRADGQMVSRIVKEELSAS